MRDSLRPAVARRWAAFEVEDDQLRVAGGDDLSFGSVFVVVDGDDGSAAPVDDGVAPLRGPRVGTFGVVEVEVSHGMLSPTILALRILITVDLTRSRVVRGQALGVQPDFRN